MRSFAALFFGALVLAAVFFTIVLSANAAPPPKQAFPVDRFTRHQSGMISHGCFHVARHQFICPLPMPKR